MHMDEPTSWQALHSAMSDSRLLSSALLASVMSKISPTSPS